MRDRAFWRSVVVLGVGALAAVACVEKVTAPAVCPDYCPGNQIVTIDSVLAGGIVRDSSFVGYVSASEAVVMLAEDRSGVDSRPIFETAAIQTRLRINAGSDTTTGPIVMDSARLSFTWMRRDATPRNVRLALYRLPVDLDSNSTFATLAPAFGTPIRVVNLDSLLALSSQHDSVTGDTILARDTLHRVITVSIKLDSAQTPFSVADSGKVAFGVRVLADSNATLVLGSSQAAQGPSLTWYNRVDSAGTLLVRPAQARGVRFDSFVSNQPAVTVDSNLVIGGIPASRALLRFALPKNIRDSTQIIRATLLLVPTGPPAVLTGDSVFIRVYRLAADLGAKSPVPQDTVYATSPLFVPTGSDTIRLEVTSLFRYFQLDTTAVPGAFVSLLTLERQDSLAVTGTEGASFTALRLYSTRGAAIPRLRLTYVPRVKFGAP